MRIWGWVAGQFATIGEARRLGIRLQAGTDAAHNRGGFGFPLHWELQLLVRAGLSLQEVIRMATLEAAVALGAENDLGTVEPGKLADIVLLDANPLEDITNTQSIWRVIKGGQLSDPNELRRLAPTGR